MASYSTSKPKFINDPAQWFRVALWFVILCVIFFAGLNALHGPLNQDEGWYLYAAREVIHGHLPYRDFFYTQGPVMPFVYAALYPIWSQLGVLGARLLTAAIGILAIVFAAGAVANCVRREVDRSSARVLVWALAGCNLYHSYFTTIPKTYALCALFLSCGFYLLSFFRSTTRDEGRLAPWGTFFAGVMFALAAGVRVSLGAIPVVAVVWLWANRRQVGRWSWFLLGLGTALGAALVFAWPLLFHTDAFLFAMRFHTEREAGGLLFALGSVARLVRFYFIIFALGIWLAIKYLFDRYNPMQSPGNRTFLVRLWIWTFLILWGMHIVSPVPYEDYTVPVMFLPVMVVSLAILAIGQYYVRVRLAFSVIVVAVCLGSISAPIVQDWFQIRQDTFWSTMKTQPDVMALREAASVIREYVDDHDAKPVLFTQDLYLAVEADLDVPRGMEMGPFGLFPNLSDEDARKYHVHNIATLRELIEKTPASIAAVSGYTFALGAPTMIDLRKNHGFCRELLIALKDRFPSVLSVFPNFGQNHTVLVILGEEDE